MKFEISEAAAHKAKIPHEVFLTNLIGNHILWFVASLGVARSFWQPVALVPVVSLITLFYTLWRARRSCQVDEWYVMCHWQLAAARSRVFLGMIMFALLVCFAGWIGYTYFGMMEVAVYAVVGGGSILPVMVTVLILIIMESDALHQTDQQKMPRSLLLKYPKPDGVVALAEPENQPGT
ncbi:hypothetical protein QQ73_01965 [Candidatus Endoriftia persephone str. Guaymas]|jgi:hypothetical protein|uniref:Uncharacterized protein n=3 Tax=Gammaproteobacteria TaxID=1236 RepID=G2FI87_9GAMM|nr:hypothetical protein [Candidatus Endoriftia persephone]EGW53514.1 hypothetical protein TevJSym_ba00320 [endosymbiont of Tevnia jerichonana (vent Tica)]MBA1329991.1 hypothetical protein [Candidatus Endoriftia persephone str. Guaymas]USF88545.1 hypothetical protein L0Y14_04730 [Candidatus Endoriftia persephone]